MAASALPSASMAKVVDGRTCMTAREIDALITTALPDMLQAGRLVCRKVLPASAFLRGNLDALERRVRAEAAFDMATADAVTLRSAGGPIPPFFFATLRQMAGLVPFYRMVKKYDARECTAVNDALAKLRTQSGREVAASLCESSVSSVEEPDAPSYRLCPAGKP